MKEKLKRGSQTTKDAPCCVCQRDRMYGQNNFQHSYHSRSMKGQYYENEMEEDKRITSRICTPWCELPQTHWRQCWKAREQQIRAQQGNGRLTCRLELLFLQHIIRPHPQPILSIVSYLWWCFRRSARLQEHSQSWWRASCMPETRIWPTTSSTRDGRRRKGRREYGVLEKW